MSENSGFFAPTGPAGSDFDADMGDVDRQAEGQEPFTQPECASPRMARLLLRYDELDPIARAGLRRHADSCAECGPRWELFQAADTWLEGAGGQHQVLCPETEDLYDFGRGPGHGYLSAERRTELELHVAHCESCRGFVATLAAPVPVPLIGDEVPLTVQRRAPSGSPPRPKRSGRERESGRTGLRLLPALERLPLWVPAAVAAGLLVTFALVNRERAANTPDLVEGGSHGAYPELPVLRGEDSSPLRYPRGNVLADESPLETPRLSAFELLPVKGAEQYRVRLRRHAGGAFDVGTELFVLESDRPELESELSALEPGHYTFEAWALVRGLERPLGERDFRVVDDPELAAAWQELEALPEAERGPGRVALLQARGFFGEARALAESLPASAARDSYLEAWPGR